jgi:hypothetical protein
MLSANSIAVSSAAVMQTLLVCLKVGPVASVVD